MPRMSRLRFPQDPQPSAGLGGAVRARRTALGLSQSALAGRSDMDFSFVAEVDRGERNVTLPSLFRLAAGLGTTPGELVDDAHRALLAENAWYRDFVRQNALGDGRD